MRPRLREHALHPAPHEIFTWEQLRLFEFRMKLKSKNKCITGASQRVTAVLVHVVMHNSLILCMFGHQTLFIYFFYSPPATHVWHRSVFSLPGLRDSRTNVSEEKRDGSGNTWAAAVGEAGGGGFAAVRVSARHSSVNLASPGGSHRRCLHVGVQRDLTNVVFLPPDLPPPRPRTEDVKSLRAAPVLHFSGTAWQPPKGISHTRAPPPIVHGAKSQATSCCIT